MRLDFQEQHPFMKFPPGQMYFPIVPVTLGGPRGKTVDTYALLDSGADVSMFHSNWARKIGINVKSGRREEVGSIYDGRICFAHRIDLQVGRNKVRCEVYFSDDIGEDINDQLVGRQVVFSKMRFALRQSRLVTYIGSMP